MAIANLEIENLSSDLPTFSRRRYRVSFSQLMQAFLVTLLVISAGCALAQTERAGELNWAADERMIASVTIPPKVMPLKELCSVLSKQTSSEFYVDQRLEETKIVVHIGETRLKSIMNMVEAITGFQWRLVDDVFFLTRDARGSAVMAWKERYLEAKKAQEAGNLEADVRRWLNMTMPFLPSVDPAWQLTPLQQEQIAYQQAISLLTLTPAQVDWLNAALRAAGFKTSEVMTPVDQLAVDLREIPVKLNAAMIIRSKSGDFLIEKPLMPIVPKAVPPAPSKVGTIKIDEVRDKGEEKKIAIKDKLQGLWITDVDLDGLDGVVRLAKTQGFDTIFIPIFKAGQPIYPSKISTQDKKYAGDDPLNKAIALAHGQGLKLIGVLDVTLWGDAEHPAPQVIASHPSIQDCNLLGRRYAEQEVWQNAEMQNLKPNSADVITVAETKIPGKEVYICPASSQAARLLKSLLAELSLNYELDGICLDRVDYAHSKPFIVAGQDLTPPFGYTVEVRKEMIRLHHIDPIDVDLWGARTDADMQALALWDKFRRGKLIGLLTELSKQFKMDNPNSIFAVTVDLASDSQSPVHWAEIPRVDALIPKLTLAKSESEGTYVYSQSEAEAIVSLNRASLKAAAVIPAAGEFGAERLAEQITALSRVVKLAKDENLRGYILVGDVSGLRAALEAIGKQVP